MGLAEKLWYINLPPSVAADDPYHQVVGEATGAAASLDWLAVLTTAGAAPKGKCFLLVEAVTQDVYVRFGASATTATTASTGMLIKAGNPGTKFYVCPVQHAFIDHYSPGGAGVIKVYVCSPIGERTDV